MIKRSWVITIVLVALAFALRFYHFEARAPFDWDQNRDYTALAKIASGQLVVLGPVAKGAGGFYLGSLYYYLLYPAYLLTRGALSSLPLTSLTLDALMAGFIYLLLSPFLGRQKSLILSLVWATSWFLLDGSRISWNVALVPLWSLLVILGFLKVQSTHSPGYLYLLGLLLGLSPHIHVATIPLIPLLILVFFRAFKYSLGDWLRAGVAALLPLLPLIAFDLTHGLLNLHLLRDQIGYQVVVKTPFLPMLAMTLTKLGKVVSALLFSRFADNFVLGLLTIFLALYSLIFDRRSYLKLAGAILVIASILIVSLHDYGFPEYYFAPAYLSIYLLILTFASDTLDRLAPLGKTVFYLAVILCLIVNLRSFTTEPTPFGLGVKSEIVATLAIYDDPIDLSYDFDPGRDGGLRDLVARQGIVLDPHSKTRILLTDKLDSPLYIDGELARDLTQIGKLKTALYIVQ